MAIDKERYQQILSELGNNVKLVAVSKTKPVADITELYNIGQRDFGENYVQELTEKQELLPKDIRWHFIGHLQSNKVKYIAPFVHLIHGVDSLNLLKEINKQAEKNSRIINCLLQVYIAKEETKFGMNEEELFSTIEQFNNSIMPGVNICGLMGMASFTDDMEKVRSEFKYLRSLFDNCSKLILENSQFTIHNSRFATLSMGMSSDYKVAVEEGSTLVRIGSLIFGERN